MNDFIQYPLCPIRFYDPDLAFNNADHFQNPDNRVSTGYNWEAVQPVPYHLPIPREYPDGQPGIDILITLDSDSTVSSFYAKLYDQDDAEYCDLYVVEWDQTDVDYVYRIFLNGNSGAGIAEGYYTIKIFNSVGDTLLLESESLLIAEWFEDAIPFEYWNFENDFGILWDNDTQYWTGRMMIPVRMFDPAPEFEKETYKNDPGVLTTLRTIMQRNYNIDSLPVPVHVAEAFQMAFACSELYLNRIKINSEEAPEAELVDGTNLKRIAGKVALVNFNERYERERVEVSFSDQNKNWNSHTYTSATITGDSIDVNTTSCAGTERVESEDVSVSDGDVFRIVLQITDDSGDGSTDLPLFSFGGLSFRLNAFGTHYLTFKMSDGFSSTDVRLTNYVGEKAVYTAVVTIEKVNVL